MSKESSRQEATTESTYIDLGADTAEGYSISSRSRQLARRMVGNVSLEDRIRQRCSIAVGDFAMADLLRFNHGAVQAGLDALEVRATIYADIRMVQIGIQKRGHGSRVDCLLDHGPEIAASKGITRTSAGMLALGDELKGSIVVIGNAPSCLLSLCELIGKGIRPALVIGCPVGFVNAAESKDELRKLDIPSISTEGTRGGTPVAVASINELITMFAEKNVK
ncbi:MAG: precorrin-8X methylmutase [Methanomassiliicoccus sp.]|nr:precorrin-8X methylmutase [Methanomassiliicoccus sp.]